MCVSRGKKCSFFEKFCLRTKWMTRSVKTENNAVNFQKQWMDKIPINLWHVYQISDEIISSRHESLPLKNVIMLKCITCETGATINGYTWILTVKLWILFLWEHSSIWKVYLYTYDIPLKDWSWFHFFKIYGFIWTIAFNILQKCTK